MNGFEKVSGCQKKKNYQCYTQFHPDQIPSLSDLARNYVISDRTFQTEITATFGSHMLLGSGTLDGFTGDFPQSAPNFPAGPGWGCDSLMDGPWRSSPGAAVHAGSVVRPVGRRQRPVQAVARCSTSARR